MRPNLDSRVPSFLEPRSEAPIETVLREALERLARAESELARLRAGVQVEARRGY